MIMMITKIMMIAMITMITMITKTDNDDDCGGNPSDILFVASDNHENALMKTTMIMMITMIIMMTYCLSPMISNITMEAVNK